MMTLLRMRSMQVVIFSLSGSTIGLGCDIMTMCNAPVSLDLESKLYG